MNAGLLLRFAGTGWLLLVSEVAKTNLAARSLMSQGLRNGFEPHAQTRSVGACAGATTRARRRCGGCSQQTRAVIAHGQQSQRLGAAPDYDL